jgi:hypothetical protein
MVFFKDSFVSSTLPKRLFGTYEPFSTLKNMIFRKYSFQKLTQFPQKNNELDAVVSNIGGFFGDIHVFLQLR